MGMFCLDCIPHANPLLAGDLRWVEAGARRDRGHLPVFGLHRWLSFWHMWLVAEAVPSGGLQGSSVIGRLSSRPLTLGAPPQFLAGSAILAAGAWTIVAGV